MEQACTFIGVENIQLSQAGLRRRRCQPLEQNHYPPAVCVDCIMVVTLPVADEINPHVSVDPPVVGDDLKVFLRECADVVRADRVAIEAQVVVERPGVHCQTQAWRLVRAQPKIRARRSRNGYRWCRRASRMLLAVCLHQSAETVAQVHVHAQRQDL